jgi:hypothetical protein
MKKRNPKRLSLNAETLLQLDKPKDLGAVVGAGPTQTSACKMASDCLACSYTC